ncbi:MAG: DUF58 domain-containing protein [Phototrophicales bacterium]|nr:MAG: DUF58 domain-containing protein [Phototrophicales bacterium]
MSSKFKIFDPNTLRKFENLTLIASQVRAGAMKGERRSVKRGTSIEFADYRDYAKGDDLRRVDWNIYARLERPFIKLLEEEEDLAVHFLLDASASMDWPREGNRDHHKFIWSLRVLAGLAYLSLSSGDFVHITALRADHNHQWGPHRGRAYTVPLLQNLEKIYTRGDTNLDIALKDYALRTRRVGLCIILSDMMSPTYKDGLSALQSRGFEVAIIQVLSPDEVNPTLDGDLRLIDVESGIPQEVTVDASMKQLYQERLLAWQEEIGDFCLRRGIHFITAETSLPWEELILYQLRRIGVVR